MLLWKIWIVGSMRRDVFAPGLGRGGGDSLPKYLRTLLLWKPRMNHYEEDCCPPQPDWRTAAPWTGQRTEFVAGVLCTVALRRVWLTLWVKEGLAILHSAGAGRGDCYGGLFPRRLPGLESCPWITQTMLCPARPHHPHPSTVIFMRPPLLSTLLT